MTNPLSPEALQRLRKAAEKLRSWAVMEVRASTVLALIDRIEQLEEFRAEVALGPWSDSEPESLLRTLAARAKALTGGQEKA